MAEGCKSAIGVESKRELGRTEHLDYILACLQERSGVYALLGHWDILEGLYAGLDGASRVEGDESVCHS